MRLVLRERALRDLEEIEAYYLREAPEALPKVLSDIRQVLRQLEDFPHSGRRVGRRNARRALTSRYRYIVSYRVTREAIEIVGIFRFQNGQCDHCNSAAVRLTAPFPRLRPWKTSAGGLFRQAV